MLTGLTIAHILTALAALAALYGLVQLGVSRRYTGAGHGAGTPGYARARDAKRYTICAAAAVILLFALAWLTPFGPIVIF